MIVTLDYCKLIAPGFSLQSFPIELSACGEWLLVVGLTITTPRLGPELEEA